MSEIKYKGIDTGKIKEVQRVHLFDMPKDIVFEKRVFEKKIEEGGVDLLESMRSEIDRFIENQAEKRVEQIELFVICEMAKLYLEQCGAIQRILERLEEEREKYFAKFEDDKYSDEEKSRFASRRIGLTKAQRIVKEEGGIDA